MSSGSHQNFNVIDHVVTFYNSHDGITLAGTLSIPELLKKPPVVILITGVGPHDQDYAHMNGHKLFLTITNYFTKRGIAVLCYDKREIGKSEGNFESVFTFDFAQDVVAAVQFLKRRSDIDTHNIGLVGHSEGGLISFMVASQSPDVVFYDEQLKDLESRLNKVIESATAEEQLELGYQFYQWYRKFVGGNLLHLHEEKTLILTELQRL